MGAFATAHCVMGKLGLQSVRNCSLEWSRSLTISLLPWAIAGGIQINIEEKKLREKYWSERGPREAYSEFAGQTSEGISGETPGCLCGYFGESKLLQRKGRKSQGRWSPKLVICFFGNLESQWCLTFGRRGRNWRNYHHLERVRKCSWRVHSRQEEEW